MRKSRMLYYGMLVIIVLPFLYTAIRIFVSTRTFKDLPTIVYSGLTDSDGICIFRDPYRGREVKAITYIPEQQVYYMSNGITFLIMIIDPLQRCFPAIYESKFTSVYPLNDLFISRILNSVKPMTAMISARSYSQKANHVELEAQLTEVIHGICDYDERRWSPEQLPDLFGASGIIISANSRAYSYLGNEAAIEIAQQRRDQEIGIRHYIPLPVFELIEPCSISGNTAISSQRIILDEDYDGLKAGQNLPYWTGGVSAQNRKFKSPPMGAKVKTSNIVWRGFPLTQGKIIFEIWTKPNYGANTNNSFVISNSPVGELMKSKGEMLHLFWKNHEGKWMCNGLENHFPLADYDGKWHHFKVIYDTSANRYDLYMDNFLMRADIQSPIDFSAGVSKIGLRSDRQGTGHGVTSYFDDLKVSVAE